MTMTSSGSPAQHKPPDGAPVAGNHYQPPQGVAQPNQPEVTTALRDGAIMSGNTIGGFIGSTVGSATGMTGMPHLVRTKTEPESEPEDVPIK